MTKIDIFSGFLGAGKTTLIKKLIQEAYQGEKLVLIENEFGEIGIDGAFMQDAGIQVNEMNSGCICCSLVGDFGRALKKVLSEYAPDRILIEPSGVGKLSDVIGAVERIDSHDIQLNAFTTVVDAKKAKVYMKNFGEFFNNQVESANAIVLSRTQLVDEAKLAETLALLREHNPSAVIITTPWSELSGKTILSAMERKDTLEAALKELSEMARKEEEEEEEHHHHHHHHDDDGECDDPECECHHHHHDDDDEDEEHEHHHHHHHHDEDEECDDPECECHHHHHDDEDEDEEHEHHHHHHHHHGHDADEVFTSWGVETANKYSRDEIEGILKKLDDAAAYGAILRAKGVVPGVDGQWIHYDYVPEEQDVRTGPAAFTGRICVIGSKLNEDALKALFRV
ncbi:MAG: GTP-binding protein [Clostridia bacterium]|nr:GTP-binding protein [Clostridia bacterium]MBR0421776.1 GTP-binding protein [Clostridia bacterium]